METEEYLRRFAHTTSTYQRNSLEDADLSKLSDDQRKVLTEPEAIVKDLLSADSLSTLELDACAEAAWKYHAEHQLFWIFDAVIARLPIDTQFISKWLDKHPLLVFCVLKAYVPTESGALGEEVSDLGPSLIQQIIRAANFVPVASLVALEKLRDTIASLDISLYLELLELVPTAVRVLQQVQETLFVLHECREAVRSSSAAMEYIHKQALSIAFDRAEEANDECPVDDDGKLKKQRNAPSLVPLFAVEDKPSDVIAHLRVDSPSTIRLHSHVRLRAASKPEKGEPSNTILDGVVTMAQVGELKISLVHTPPPEFANMEWYLYDAGSVGVSAQLYTKFTDIEGF